MSNLYMVCSPGGQAKRIEAKDSAAAKRKYCRMTDRKPGDKWTGISVLSAKQIKTDGRCSH